MKNPYKELFDKCYSAIRSQTSLYRALEVACDSRYESFAFGCYQEKIWPQKESPRQIRIRLLKQKLKDKIKYERSLTLSPGIWTISYFTGFKR